MMSVRLGVPSARLALQITSLTRPQPQHIDNAASPPHTVHTRPAIAPLNRPLLARKRPCPIAAAATAAAAAPCFPGGWSLWAAIAACAALSQVIERRTRLGLYLSAPLLATVLALAAASVGLIPSVAPVYDTIWTYGMPLAAALYLLESDISELARSAGPSVVAFFNGALGTVIGTVAAFALFGRFLGPDGSKVAAALCASYIGGSVNFAAVAGLLGLTSGPTLAAAMTADNLAMAAYIAVIMSIPATLPAALAAGGSGGGASDDSHGKAPITSETLALALAAAAIACAMGNAAASAAGFSSGGLAFTALIASGVATAAGALKRKFVGRGAFTLFSGAESLGGALMLLFFATIGAAAGSLGALRGAGWLLAFIGVQLSLQLAISLGLGRLMNLPTPVVLIAANANVGGPATAAAMAGAKGWKALVQPAVLTGALGYAIANGIGWAMGTWLGGWTFA